MGVFKAWCDGFKLFYIPDWTFLQEVMDPERPPKEKEYISNMMKELKYPSQFWTPDDIVDILKVIVSVLRDFRFNIHTSWSACSPKE